MSLRFLLPILACSVPLVAEALEWSTHAHITDRSFTRLVAEETDLLRRLGIYRRDDAFSTARYFDVTSFAVRPRIALGFEIAKMPRNAKPYSIEGWLMRGAIREDDDELAADKSPKNDDPDGDIHRVFRHFFDPVNNRAMRVGFGLVDPCTFTGDFPIPCHRAIDWGLGTANWQQSPLTPEPDRRNSWTVFDAREAMYRALTGKSAAFLDVAPAVTQRASYWATTFRALGDVLHLNQDMAQPQHTRNDPHAGSTPQLITGHKSTFEQFVEASIRGDQLVEVGTDTPVGGLLLNPILFNLDGYPTPRFANYTDYWTTSNFRGLANYSNRGFFTAGTNMNRSSYDLPSRNLNDYSRITLDPVRWDGTPSSNPAVKITFFSGTVPDANRGTPDQNVLLTAFGAWDQFVTTTTRRNAFTLMRENYIDQARLLLPRAVAYSTGLLRYFFRGKLKLSLPPEQVYAVEDFAKLGQPGKGFTKFKVMVKNDTADIQDGTTSFPQPLSEQGTLTAVIRYRRNTCLKYPSLEGAPGSPTWNEGCRSPSVASQLLPDIIVSDQRAVTAAMNTEPQAVVFTLETPLPYDATDLDLQVVYRGPIGSEQDGIAVGFEFLSEPSFLNFDNYGDCKQPTSCPQGSTDPQCMFNVQVPLPFFFAAEYPRIVGVQDLKPGEHSRVAFITYAGYISHVPGGFFVPLNQNYPDPVEVVWPATGETIATWSGPTTNNFLRQRPLIGDQQNMYSWDGIGVYDSCAGGCSGFEWAQSCAPMDPTPKGLLIFNFPTSD